MAGPLSLRTNWSSLADFKFAQLSLPTSLIFPLKRIRRHALVASTLRIIAGAKARHDRALLLTMPQIVEVLEAGSTSRPYLATLLAR